MDNTNTFFDYELALRKDTKFQQGLNDRAVKCAKLAESARANPKYKKQLDAAIMDLLRFTNFNLTPLLSFYFPRYPRTDAFSLRNFPYAYAMFNLTFGRESVLCIKGSRQIIKSTCLAIRDILSLQLFNGLRSMLITPRIEQLKTLGDKYKEVSQAYRFNSEHKNYRQNLFYKEWPNQSVLKMVYVLTNADKVRGNSMDWLNYDEYQDFDPSLELEVEEVITQSPMPMVTKTGTSKTVDSALETTYETTSRSLWRMRCEGCNHDNYPTLEHNVMEMIQPKGVCCVKCGKPLDVRKGQWDHQSINMLNAGRIGLHVPKIIVPENTERAEKWWPIYQQSLKKDKKEFYEEVLGIATQEGAREITVKELEAVSDLGPRAALLKKAKAGGYRYVISGCDWGGSDYIPAHKLKQSYTVHALIGVTKDWNFEIIHFDQYSGMKYGHIAGGICDLHKRYNGHSIASDFGVGGFYNMLIREHVNPHRHVIYNYTGPNSVFTGESTNAHLYNQLSLNKTDSITSLFNELKNGRIRCFNWNESCEFMTQFTNMIRSPTDAGNITYRRHGARPDDALHAVNFAIQLAKLVIGETAFEDEAVRDAVLERISGPTGASARIRPDGVDVISG